MKTLEDPLLYFEAQQGLGEQKRLGNADLGEGEDNNMQMKLEEPLKCETKSRAIRSNTREFFSVVTTSQTAAGCLAGLILVLPHPAAVKYSCRSEVRITSIFRVSKIVLEGRLSAPMLSVASH